MKILMIDDEPELIEVISWSLEYLGAKVDGCTNPEEGLKKALTGNYDLVLVDYCMPNFSGEKMAIELAMQGIKFLIYTGMSATEFPESLRHLVISKPAMAEDIMDKIKTA